MLHLSPRASALLESAIVWDNHTCFPLRAEAGFLPQLERYRQAGISVVSINAGFADSSWVKPMRVLSFMRQWIRSHSDDYRLVSSAADILYCKREKKLGVVFDIEGMGPVIEDPSFVQTFYELGVRWMLIAYNRNNAAGGGCLDEDCGLSALGRRIIDEMERVGMALCLSHAGARTAAEAIEYARNPMIFSHSNPYAVTAHPRNISDKLMKACADKGGVVGFNGIGVFLGGGENLVERLLQQLRHGVDLVGAAHIGLGLDFTVDSTEVETYVRSNPSLFPPGMDVSGAGGMIAPEQIGDITEGLARDNLTDTQIRGILGENWMRIAMQVWR